MPESAEAPEIRILERLITTGHAWCDDCLAAALELDAEATHAAALRLVTTSLLFSRWAGRCPQCRRAGDVTGQRASR